MRRTAVLVGALVLATACMPARSKVVYEEAVTIAGGEGRAFTLSPGTYELRLLASGGMVSVEWIGGSCPRVERTDSLSARCEITREGQLVVRHPEPGTGPISVALNVRRETR